MLASVNKFISNLDKHNGPAKVERFLISIIYPPAMFSDRRIYDQSRDLQLQTFSGEIPGQTLFLGEYRTYGPIKKFATLRMYSEINISIFCTNEYYERPLIEEWMEFINPRSSGWNFRYKDEYASMVLINQYPTHHTDVSNPAYEMILEKAFPIAISPSQLKWSEDAVQQFTVTFSYDTYTTRHLKRNNYMNRFIDEPDYPYESPDYKDYSSPYKEDKSKSKIDPYKNPFTG